MTKYHPYRQLLWARLREFLREPEAVFWTYGFPLLLAIGLGVAFRERAPEQVFVDIQKHPGAEQVLKALSTPPFSAEIHTKQECRDRLRLGKSSIVVVPGESYTFFFDPTRPESALARLQVDDALQRAAGRRDVVPTTESHLTEPGARYIDFLLPGLLGMNLMGSGLWGVGFVLVDMRVRKLLKRFFATPMKRTQFLWSIIGGRLMFMIPEIVVILGAGALLFDVLVRGSLLAILVLCLVGNIAFAGIGLLVASRAQRIETVSGLMNLVMLPMWILSGIFFSPDRFPSAMQPFIQSLPLTQLNNALRAVILEGAPLYSQGVPMAVLGIWSLVSFVLAIRWFRWT
jgi:ABC-type multidrug transport system permease subunit